MILKYIFDRVVCTNRTVVPLASPADCSNIGESEDAWRACVLCAEESGEGRQIV